MLKSLSIFEGIHWLLGCVGHPRARDEATELESQVPTHVPGRASWSRLVDLTT